MSMPEIPTSVFVLVPKTVDEKEFATVVDKDKLGGKKLPGGGASTDRAISNSAQAEVFEETRLVIHPPALKVLEVHKADSDGKPHHWVAVKSLPPVSCDLLAKKQASLVVAHGDVREALESDIKSIQQEWPLESGDEIAEARWETAENIMMGVAERKFFRDHGVAFRWYLSGRSQTALDDILRDRRIVSYFVDEEGCLVLCYDPNCEMCERDEEPSAAAEPAEETMERYFPKNGAATRPSYSGFSPVRETKMKPVPPEEQKLSGEIELMLVVSNRFEDRVYLKLDQFGSYLRHSVEVERRNAVAPAVVMAGPTTTAKLAEKFGLEAKRQVSVEKPGRTAVLIVCEAVCAKSHLDGTPCGKAHAPAGLVGYSLNEAPPVDFKISVEQAKILLEAVERFNRAHRLAMLWMHPAWQGLIAKIKFEEAIKRQERYGLPNPA